MRLGAESTPGGGGYYHTIPIRVCAVQRGRDFRAPDLERGIQFRDVSRKGMRYFEGTKDPVL